MMKAYFVEFPAKDQCVLSSEELPPLKPDQILIKSDYSLISAGTELANYHGLPNTGGGNGDFPMRIGYSTSGHVLEVGQDVQNFRPGDKVAVAWGGHRSHIISNESGTVLDAADVKIPLITGPEVITGSTRMKAATAQKLTVNMISTTSMIKLGRVTGNFMTAMRPTNTKLRKRAKFIVSSICDISEDEAGIVLEKHDFNIREAVKELRQKQGE